MTKILKKDLEECLYIVYREMRDLGNHYDVSSGFVLDLIEEFSEEIRFYFDKRYVHAEYKR